MKEPVQDAKTERITCNGCGLVYEQVVDHLALRGCPRCGMIEPDGEETATNED